MVHQAQGQDLSLDTFFKKLGGPAPNIIEWASRPEYLNFIIEDEDSEELRGIYEHYGQYETLRDFFELLCPICSRPEDQDCWGKSRETLEAQTLLIWSAEYKEDICPKCHSTRSELEESGMFNAYDTMLLIVGMRSSKSTTAGIIGSFIEHKVLLSPSPQKFLGQAPRQLFEVSFVATTAKQSEKTVYEVYKGLRDNSPWVQSYLKRLKEIEKFKGQYYDDGSSTSVKYKHINVNFESLNSNSSGIAGGTRIAAFIDELARFDTTESKRSAKEIYRVFNQGLRTIRSVKKRKNIPNCYGLLVSTTSPLTARDYSMQLGQKAAILKKMYFIHKSTWAFNPYEPEENFVEDFKLDPAGAARDFGATPPLAEIPFVTDVENFHRSIDDLLKPTAIFKYISSKDPTGIDYVAAQVEFCQLDRISNKVIFGDAGKSGDSFGLACAHGEWKTIDIAHAATKVWVTVFDWIMAIVPTQNPRRIVSFTCIPLLVKDLATKHKIAMIRFDRWNSESIIQELRQSRIDSDVFKLRVEHYKTFIQDVYGSKVSMLPPLPSDAGEDPYHGMSAQGRVIHEILHLERSPDLKSVDHRAGEHNDLAVCVVGAHYLVQSVLPTHFLGGAGSAQGVQHAQDFVGSIGKFRRW
jgi:hypothetical protein